MKKIFFSILLSTLTFSVARAQQDGYAVGDTAKDFSLLNINGKVFSLNQLAQAKGYIVVFTCNHCPFSQAYEQRIIDLDKKYAPLGYPVVAINPNDPVAEPEDSYPNMIKRAKEKGYTFPYLLDSTQQTAKIYGAKRTPHVYLLSKTSANILRVEYIGAIDDNFDDPAAVKEKYLEKAIEAVSKGSKPAVTLTKAIGCGIKWKKP
jgi:peroxiredoxin